jgi:hypothetical protein
MANKTSSPSADPEKRAVDMLKKVYASLPVDGKDMPEGEFIKQSLTIIKEGKKRKNGPLILPGQ